MYWLLSWHILHLSTKLSEIPSIGFWRNPANIQAKLTNKADNLAFLVEKFNPEKIRTNVSLIVIDMTK